MESGSCKTPSCFAQSVPAHRDKAEIKCMGPVGEKHQLNRKCICSSLTLSIVSKTKLMDNKIMSAVFDTFVRSDCSTQWEDNPSIFMFCLYLLKIECATF